MVRSLKGFLFRSRNDIKSAGFDRTLAFLVMLSCIDIVMMLAVFPLVFVENAPFFVIATLIVLGLLLFRCWVGSLGQDVRMTDLNPCTKAR